MDLKIPVYQINTRCSKKKKIKTVMLQRIHYLAQGVLLVVLQSYRFKFTRLCS